MVKKKILALSLAAIMILATGCSSNSAKNTSSSGTGDIIIGSLLDLSAGMATAGLATQWGINYAIKQINDAGGINGRKLKAVQYDIKSDVNASITAYNRLVDQDKVVAIIGPGLSNIGIALAPIAETKKVAIVSQFMDEHATTNAKINSPWKYIYLAEPSCTQQADDIASYAVDVLKVKSVAIIYNSSNAFATSHAGPFKSYVTSKSVKVTDEESYTSDAKDYKAQLTKIIATNPDAIFIGDYVQGDALAYQQARQLGYTGIILGTNTFSSPFNTLVAGTSIKNLFFIFNVDYNSANTKFLGDAYSAANNNAPPVANVAFGYDDVQIIANALKLAKNPTDPVEVNKLIETKTDNVLTSSGPITIDPKTHRPSNMGVYIADYDASGKTQLLTFYKV